MEWLKEQYPEQKGWTKGDLELAFAWVAKITSKATVEKHINWMCRLKFLVWTKSSTPGKNDTFTIGPGCISGGK